jgi:hypothetical protein
MQLESNIQNKSSLRHRMNREALSEAWTSRMSALNLGLLAITPSAGISFPDTFQLDRNALLGYATCKSLVRTFSTEFIVAGFSRPARTERTISESLRTSRRKDRI